MKYVPPYGVSDPEAPYVNGSPATGQQGSIPPAAAFENPQRELVNVITKSNIIPSDADLLQLAKAVRSQFLNYVDDTGSINNLSVALDPPLASYTRGLVVRVRVRNTNTGSCRINAGAGNVPIRKMNGADLFDAELPAGAVATLVYDGAVFQLSNFGGGGAGGTIYQNVKIPYTVDQSTTPNIVRANFSPPLDQLGAGDMIAVKIANTNTGPTVIFVDSQPQVELRPNGGGVMLQGDLHINDIVIFFYDGVNFYFAPNPEIDAPIEYTVGTGQHFPSLEAGMDALHRKTIGATGYVTFRLIRGEYNRLDVSHPSADRIMVRGTMIGSAPKEGDFARTGIAVAQRANDAVFNNNMLRARFGTVINISTYANAGPPFLSNIKNGISNTGPGTPTFQDLLIVGTRTQFEQFTNSECGIYVAHGHSISVNNVAIWGTQFGTVDVGGCTYTSCWVTACMRRGFWSSGAGGSTYQNCHCFGGGGPTSEYPGMGHHSEAFYGTMFAYWCSAQTNSNGGFVAPGGTNIAFWYCRALGNGPEAGSVLGGTDLFCGPNAQIHVIYGPGRTHSIVGTYTPPLMVTDWSGAIITEQIYWPDPGSNPWA